MAPEEIAQVEADLLSRLKDALASAQFGEGDTAEDARAFLFKTFDSLLFIAQAQAGLPIAKPN